MGSTGSIGAIGTTAAAAAGMTAGATGAAARPAIIIMRSHSWHNHLSHNYVSDVAGTTIRWVVAVLGNGCGW